MLEWDWSARITCCLAPCTWVWWVDIPICVTCHSYLTTFSKSIWELRCTQLVLLYVVRSSHCHFLSLWYKSCLDYRIFLRARINNSLWSQGDELWSVVVQDARHTHDKAHIEDNHVKKNQGPHESIEDEWYLNSRTPNPKTSHVESILVFHRKKHIITCDDSHRKVECKFTFHFTHKQDK